jgi:hypothetical protein
MTENNERIRERINIAAYYLAQMNYPYDTLCWMLAERQLYLQQNFQTPEKNLIKKKAAEIFFSTPPYDILCWLISEFDINLKIKRT